MAWFIRFTRYASTHLVYSQEAEQSCGIACTMMAVMKINKFTLKKANLVEKQVYKTYTKVVAELFPSYKDQMLGKGAKKYTGSVPAFTGVLKETLNRLDVGKWDHQELKPADVPAAIIDSVDNKDFPIIVRTNWNTKDAHFVLIDELFEGNKVAAVCDPWDGDVHITKIKAGAEIDYVANAPRLSWSVFGKKHEYVGTSNGLFSGWVVRRIG